MTFDELNSSFNQLKSKGDIFHIQEKLNSMQGRTEALRTRGRSGDIV